MTPQERQLVDDLFDRLARLETAPRDADAERAIADGLARAPNAVYALVQTVLVQDEALKRADQRIRELSGAGEAAPQGGGFLDSMRETVIGRPANASVPSVRSDVANEPDSRWNRGGAYAGGQYGNAAANAAPAAGAAPWQGGGGGSFLGTAAASAVGAIGGALLFNSISSMFGHRSPGSAFADAPHGGSGAGAASPWDNSASGGDLARDAGLNDIGQGVGGDAKPAGFFDDADQTNVADAGNDFGNDFDGDFGGDGGDSA